MICSHIFQLLIAHLLMLKFVRYLLFVVRRSCFDLNACSCNHYVWTRSACNSIMSAPAALAAKTIMSGHATPDFGEPGPSSAMTSAVTDPTQGRVPRPTVPQDRPRSQRLTRVARQLAVTSLPPVSMAQRPTTRSMTTQTNLTWPEDKKEPSFIPSPAHTSHTHL